MTEQIKMIKISITLFVLVLDTVFFLALYRSLTQLSIKPGNLLYSIQILVTLFFLSLFLTTKIETSERNPALLMKFYRIVSLFLVFYMPKLMFIAFQLLKEILILLQKGWIYLSNSLNYQNTPNFSFSILSYAGIALSVLLAGAIIYGILFGRFDFSVEKTELAFDNLPKNFNNFRIVQFSDIHLGTLKGKEKQVEKAVSMINGLQPDLILFTGDMVNNFSEEALGWPSYFKELNAKYGKYSILGNHDYGNYWNWNSEEDKAENMKLLYRIEKEMGFKLLLNESDSVFIDGEKIGIVGVENWGRPPFDQFGDLQKALSGNHHSQFNILMSHDPSHWEEEVIYNDRIDLTLSGHTHGMQFGIKIGKFKWSPVQYLYKQWSGLYRKNGQYLYVNRGLGHIGYLGRFGMPPEITLITLKTAGTMH